MRSYLYVPGDNTRFLAKIATSSADAIILDLEDSVKTEAKSVAENTLHEFLASSDHKNLMLRVEPSRLREAEDLINHPKITKIYLPKADSQQVIDNLNLMNHSHKPIHALIESSLGLEKITEIAQAQNIQSLGIGEADFFAEIALTEEVHANLKSFVRSRVVIASSAYNLLPPVAPVSSNFADLTAFQQETREFLRLGYWGRACIHPAQIDIANEIFAIDPDLRSRAEFIVNALEQSNGGATVDRDGRMIDAAHLKWAWRYLSL